MPGLVGLITKMPRERAVAQLDRMVRAVHHESFYETGTWIDETLGVYVGWAIRRGSFCEGLPLLNEKQDVALFLSGSVYAEPQVAQALKARGHSIVGQPASYLVHAYEENPELFAGLNGLFHGLVVDQRRQTATLFNDRYGMHRLCYHEANDVFYFAAEAKAILAALPELRRPDERSLGEFVACSCVLENRTIFKNIQALPSGSAWIFRNASLAQKTNYFDAKKWEEQDSLSEAEYRVELGRVIARNLPLYFSGDERVGMTLTGGLDTRLIMAWHKADPGTLPCYTFGGTVRDCEDVRIARHIAKMSGQPYEIIELGNEFLSRFPHYAERSIYLTEGGADVYRASDLFVSEKAREIAPAKVVGTYGSEIIRHAVMFKAIAPADGLFRPEFRKHIQNGVDTYNGLRSRHPLTFAAFMQSPWYHQGILALESSQLTVRSPYLDSDFVRTVFRGPQTNGSSIDIRLALIQDGSPELARIPSDRGVGGITGSSYPITRGIREFTFKAEYAYDYGMPQWASRIDSWLAPLHIDRLFLGRHKISHFRVWYRDRLSAFVRDILLDQRTLAREYLNPDAVRTVVLGHTQRGLNYTTAIHKLLTLEFIQRIFFEAR